MYPSSATALQDLNTFNSTRRSSNDIVNEAQSKYDIPGINTRLSRLRGLVGNLQSSVEAVDPSVTGRTAGSFVTEGQRQALVSKERAPILTDLGKQQNALGDEQQGYSLASTLADSLSRAMMQDDQTKYQSFLDRYNASSAYEREQEAKRQFEENLKLQREQIAASERNASKAAAAGAGGYNLGSLLGGGGGDSAPAAPKVTAADQLIYNQAKRLSAALGSQAWATKEFNALLKSAGFGNGRDRQVLQTFYQLRNVQVPANFKKAILG